MGIEKARLVFDKANFIRDIGCELVRLEEGYCEAKINILPKHLQQDGFVHAGVIATIADHTAGTASATVVADDITVLSVEFKINLLRPAIGNVLISKAKVLKAGKMLTVLESEVFMENKEVQKMVAKATVTIANVKY